MQVANYMHLSVRGGRATAAIGIQQEESGEETAYVGMAFCSPKDQFSKKTGRLIAEGRLNKGKWFYKITLDPTKKVAEQIRGTIEASVDADYEALPRWVLRLEE